MYCPPQYGDYGQTRGVRQPKGARRKKKGGLFRKIRKFKLGRAVRKVARIAVPVAVGGLVLAKGIPLVRKGVGALFRKKARPAVTEITPEGPVVMPAVEEEAPSVVETAAKAAGAAAKFFTAPMEIPGVTPEEVAPAPPAVMRAGLFGGAGGGQTLVLLAAAGLAALAFAPKRRR